mgnify:CR=1 FL=1
MGELRDRDMSGRVDLWRDLMGLMGLCARRGDELAVRVEGPDEEACAAALREVFTF